LLGVASKYLQNYINWFHVKEKITESEFIESIIELSVANTNAINDNINFKHAPVPFFITIADCGTCWTLG